MTERIVDVFWEGPHDWLDRKQHLEPGHALYALYGAHHSYGQNVLLYIGRTNNMRKRLIAHAPWVQDDRRRYEVSGGISWRDLDLGRLGKGRALRLCTTESRRRC